MGDTSPESLRRLPLFEPLGDAALELLGGQLVPRALCAGEFVFRRGDPGGGMFLVTSGEVELFVTNTMGQKLVLETVGPGGFFGEISLVDGEARSADARAVTEASTLRLDRDSMELLLVQHPRAAFELMGQITRRLRQANALLRHGSAGSPNQTIEEKATAFQRFADYLARVSGTLPFLLFHFFWFATWVLINQGVVPGAPVFDPFPFGLLTMVVSLEAIFLSCVVLISQNRQEARDRIRSDAEYEANIRSSLEVTQLHVKLDHFESLVTSRLDALQRVDTAPKGTRKAG